MIGSDDRKAFEKAVAAQWDDMAEITQCILDASPQDAEDWLQDGLLAIWKGFANGTRPGPVAKWRTYILTAAINRGYEVLDQRARRREVRFSDIETDPETPYDPVAPSDELAEREEAEELSAQHYRVTRAADLLPPRERELILARFAEPDESLSARLGITVKSLQQMFSRAARHLRAPQGGGVSASSRFECQSTFPGETPLRAMGKNGHRQDEHQGDFFSSFLSMPVAAGDVPLGPPGCGLAGGLSPALHGGRGTRIDGRVLIWRGRWVVSGDG